MSHDRGSVYQLWYLTVICGVTEDNETSDSGNLLRKSLALRSLSEMAASSATMSDSEDDLEDVDRGSTSEECISDGELDSDESDLSDVESSTTDDQDDGVHVNDGVWMAIMGDDPGPTPLPFLAVPGPRHALPPDSKPVDYAMLFLTHELVDHIVVETNRYATQWIGRNQQYLQDHPKSMVHSWIKSGATTREEIYAFISIVLNMGVTKKPTIRSYWDSTNPSQATPWFNEHFNRDRFTLLLKFLHFADNLAMPEENDPAFKTFKVKFLVDYLNKKFKYYFSPNKDISIDKSMIGYKGKTPHLRQYMPNKHHARFGLKVWCLCDSTTGYLHTFEIYTGTSETDREGEGATYNLVMRIMTASRLLNLGHHLGLDNYFTSSRLLFDLFAAHTSATGTVRRNRKGLPATVVKASLRNKEVCERRKGDLLCVAYRDGTKTPLLLSTHAAAGFQETRNTKGKEKTLPKCIVQYNKAMGGVDLSDARLYCYLGERRSLRWPSKVAFSLFGRCILNAYIIYDQNTNDTKKMTRYEFTVSVIEGLMGDFRPSKTIRKRRSKADIAAAQGNQTPPPTAPVHTAVPGPSRCKLVKLEVGKRRDCVNNHPKRVQSSFECPACNVGLCPACFAPYHQSK